MSSQNVEKTIDLLKTTLATCQKIKSIDPQRLARLTDSIQKIENASKKKDRLAILEKHLTDPVMIENIGATKSFLTNLTAAQTKVSEIKSKIATIESQITQLNTNVAPARFRHFYENDNIEILYDILNVSQETNHAELSITIQLPSQFLVVTHKIKFNIGTDNEEEDLDDFATRCVTHSSSDPLNYYDDDVGIVMSCVLVASKDGQNSQKMITFFSNGEQMLEGCNGASKTSITIPFPDNFIEMVQVMKKKI